MTNDPQFLEIRTYQLKPGTREAYHRIATEGAVPLLRQYGIRVVHAGPCSVDANSYVLIRAFASLEERTEQETRFYTSDDWKQQLSEDILSRIESYQTVVLPVSAAAVEALGAPALR